MIEDLVEIAGFKGVGPKAILIHFITNFNIVVEVQDSEYHCSLSLSLSLSHTYSLHPSKENYMPLAVKLQPTVTSR